MKGETEFQHTAGIIFATGGAGFEAAGGLTRGSLLDGAEVPLGGDVTYRESPVNGSMCCPGPPLGVDVARYLEAPKVTKEKRIAPKSTFNPTKNQDGGRKQEDRPVKGSTYSSPGPAPMFTPDEFLSINFTTSSRYVIGRSLLCRNLWAALYGFSVIPVSIGESHSSLISLDFTCSVIGQLQWRGVVLNINVKYVVVFLSLVELLAGGAYSINDLAYFLPLVVLAFPLHNSG